MALRKILTQGDPSLEKACRPVEKFPYHFTIFINSLFDKSLIIPIKISC